MDGKTEEHVENKRWPEKKKRAENKKNLGD